MELSNKNRLIQWSTGILYLGLALIFADLLVEQFRSGLMDRPFFLDGSFWFTESVNFSRFFHDSAYTRFISFLSQSPAVIYLKFYKEPTFEMAKTIWSLSLTFFYLVGLLPSLLTAYQQKNSLFAHFILFSFFICYLTNSGFAVGVVPETLTCAWLLASLIFLSPFQRWPSWVAAGGIYFVLLFSYEQIFIFFFACSILVYRRRDLNSVVKKILYAFLSFGIFIVGIRLFILPSGSTNNFKNSLSAMPTPGFLIAAVIVSSIILLFLVHSRWPQLRWWIVAVGLLGLSFVTLRYDIGSIWSPYLDRIWAIPCLSLMLVIFSLVPSNTMNLKLPLLILLAAAGIFQLASVHQDGRNWQKAITLFDRQLEAPGCQAVDKNSAQTISGLGIDPWTFPYLSIVRQNGHVNSLLIPSDDPSCQLVKSSDDFRLKNGMRVYLRPTPLIHFSFKND